MKAEDGQKDKKQDFFRVAHSFNHLFEPRRRQPCERRWKSRPHPSLSPRCALFSPMGSVALHPVRLMMRSLFTRKLWLWHTRWLVFVTQEDVASRESPRRRTPTVTVNPSLNPWSVEVYLVEARRFNLHAVSVWIDVLCVPTMTHNLHTYTHTHTHTHFHVDRTVL